LRRVKQRITEHSALLLSLTKTMGHKLTIITNKSTRVINSRFCHACGHGGHRMATKRRVVIAQRVIDIAYSQSSGL